MVFGVAMKYSGRDDISISEEHADSALYDTLVSLSNAAWCHNPEDHNLNTHHRKKPQNFFLFPYNFF